MTDRPTQQDVMLAILAMDAYSRGKDRQLEYSTDVELATTIGTATWVRSSNDLELAGKLNGANAVGFSASQYTLAGGQTVISYRGTDFHIGSLGQALGTLQDVATGWLASFGVTGTDFAGARLQHDYAKQFYELVTGRKLRAVVAAAGGQTR